MPNQMSNPWQHTQEPRGFAQVPSSRSYEGRFGRLFRELPAAEFSGDQLDALAQTMISPFQDVALGNLDDQENPLIPAGYTYFGQFIGHDLTFDPTSLLDRKNDPNGLLDFRTPRFDLDSLYGRGPADQPYLYTSDGALAVGDSRSNERQFEGPDLPRVKSGRAVIGDPRNDENKIVSQLHSVFIRFHNWVLKQNGGNFDEAQRLVRWQYQWLVLNDYLQRFVPKQVIDAILVPDRYVIGVQADGQVITASGYRPVFRHFTPHDEAFLPVEFSAAAFRFGHSMVRATYAINDRVSPPAPRNRFPVFSPGGQATDDLRSFGPLPDEWGIQWGYFFPLRADARLPQKSYRIDEHLANPLGDLPTPVVFDLPRSLARRTLQRGVSLGLPSGEDTARAIGITPLSSAQLFDDPALQHIFDGSTPLWYYILREANVLSGGARLGPVGGTIVAEVIIGLLWNDAHSFLRQDPGWQPPFGRTVAELLSTIGAPI